MKKLWKCNIKASHLWEGIYLASRAGYDLYIAGLIPMFHNAPDSEIIQNPQLWSKVQTALDRTGITLSSLGHIAIDDFDHPNPLNGCDAIDPDTLMPYFRFADTHPLGSVSTIVWSRNYDYSLEHFARLCHMCEDYGLDVHLKNVSWSPIDTPSRALELIRDSGCKNARITLDPMHLYYSSVLPEEIKKIPPELIGECHIGDVPHVTFPDTDEGLAIEGRSNRPFPGESGVNLAQWIRLFPREAVYVPEMHNPKRISEWGTVEYTYAVLERCKAYFIANQIPL